MKGLILTFCMFCVFSGRAQNPASGLETVLGHMKEQESFWNMADVKSFMKYYWHNDSLKFIGSKGITYGWQKTLDNYLKAYPSKELMGTLTFGIIEATAISDNFVYVIGKWDLKREKSVGGYFTLLWKKIEGDWVIVADHTS